MGKEKLFHNTISLDYLRGDRIIEVERQRVFRPLDIEKVVDEVKEHG